MLIIENPELYLAEIEESIPEGEKFTQDGFDFQGLETAYLEDIYPGEPITDGDANSWEAAQGSSLRSADGSYFGGNCGTIANIVALAACKDPDNTVESVIYPNTPSRTGCYCIRFADGLKYQWIAIDSRVPINRWNKPMYCRPTQPEHGFWGSLLEKACATIRGDSYQEITNHAQQGIAFPGWFPSIRTSATNFEQAKRIIDAGGYAIFAFPKQLDDETGEVIRVPGIVLGHAFACVDAAQVVDDDGEKHDLIRIENPWRGGADYQGPYNDKSEFWNNASNFNHLVDASSQSGGNWWMSWQELLDVKRESSILFIEKIPTPEFPYVKEAYAKLSENTFTPKRWPNLDQVKDAIAPIELIVNDYAPLRISLKWWDKQGPCHARIFCVNEDGVVIHKSPYAWWGRHMTYNIDKIEKGKYYFYPVTVDMHSDIGLMHIIFESDKEFGN